MLDNNNSISGAEKSNECELLRFSININDFNLKQEYFDHRTLIHGISHTYRVMCNVLKLGLLLNYDRETRQAFFSAFIHDMARTHDGKCSKHGKRAAERKLGKFVPLFKSNGLEDSEVAALESAVTFHSLHDDLPLSHPHYIALAILKDGDALDRIRIGAGDLKLKYLRFKETEGLINYAEDLYHKSRWANFTTFGEYWALAATI